jgi:uncharacterized OB-fold protein
MADFTYVTEGMFRPDVVALVNGAPALVGSRCGVCGDSRFPRAEACPVCHAPSEQLVSHAFAGSGTLVTCCRIERAPPGFRVPYLVGYMQLDAGPRVLAQIAPTDVEPKLLIGRRCVVEVGGLSETAAGVVLGYRFALEPS